ncbi:hypothetical protein ABZ835_43495 [Streptomyces sp. NPDC047461]|uniref:phosphoketolase family protein n=1 Tax=Streptomyces sp. NPDC047461 TaxID=3155619 RepID=UPI0033F087F6
MGRSALIWEWAGAESGEREPDVVLAATGDVPTQEVPAAAQLHGMSDHGHPRHRTDLPETAGWAWDGRRKPTGPGQRAVRPAVPGPAAPPKGGAGAGH